MQSFEASLKTCLFPSPTIVWTISDQTTYREKPCCKRREVNVCNEFSKSGTENISCFDGF